MDVDENFFRYMHRELDRNLVALRLNGIDAAVAEFSKDSTTAPVMQAFSAQTKDQQLTIVLENLLVRDCCKYAGIRDPLTVNGLALLNDNQVRFGDPLDPRGINLGIVTALYLKAISQGRPEIEARIKLGKDRGFREATQLLYASQISPALTAFKSWEARYQKSR